MVPSFSEMNTSLIHYRSVIVAKPENFDLAGMKMFANYFKIYGTSVVPIDRTGTVRFPIRTTSLFPIPDFHPLSRSFEDICDERALEILGRGELLNKKIYVFWSGGIDSTLVLVSFLKNASVVQKRNVVVLMSEESITENPNFYNDHIRGQLTIQSSANFPLLLGTPHLIVNGEHCDQLFGSDIVAKFVAQFGAAEMHKPYSRETIADFYRTFLISEADTNFYVDMFERVKNAAPVPIDTNYLFFWWINFALKWQTVSIRTLSFASARNIKDITPSYVENNYIPFYRTNDFQLWSMSNLDKKIRDEWRTYKWPAKEIIYNFTKDADYRDNKIKRGSLHFLVVQQKNWPFIDEHFHFSQQMDREQYYEPNNDFI